MEMEVFTKAERLVQRINGIEDHIKAIKTAIEDSNTDLGIITPLKSTKYFHLDRHWIDFDSVINAYIKGAMLTVLTLRKELDEL